MKYLLLVVFALFLCSCTVTGPGEKGVRVTLGKASDGAYSPGVHLYVPFISRVKNLDVRIQKSMYETNAASKDMQTVNTKFAINWRLDSSQVVTIFKTIGYEDDVLNNIIEPNLSEVLKATTAKKTAEEILTRREELKTEVDKVMQEKMSKYGVIIESINITDVQFSQDFAHAIEQKQVAEQRAKQAEYESLQMQKEAVGAVNKAKGQAEANLTLARAQAESQKLLQQTVTPQILQLKAIEKWSGNMPQVLGGGSNLLFNIPGNNKNKE